MAGYVGRLENGQTLSAKDYFDGAWREFARIELDADESRLFSADEVEYSIIVMRGIGNARVAGKVELLTPGSAITIAFRASAEIQAVAGPLELFVTSLDVDREILAAAT